MADLLGVNRPLRGAVIGFGFIASQGHLPVYWQRSKLYNDVEIVAVADICPARRSLVQKIYPGVRVYSNPESLLEKESSCIDFVDIATPPSSHSSIAHFALDRKLHVLCEKPIATDVQSAESMLRRADEMNRVLFPCHSYKHAPIVKAVTQLIRAGRIGCVRSVTLNTFRPTHAKGVSEWRSHWRRERKYSGGGVGMDHGCHTFYLAFEWMGSYPIALTAKTANLEVNSKYFDTEDNFSACLTFPTGMGQTHLSWTAGIRKVIYVIQGDRGGITVHDDELQVAKVKDSKNGNYQWDLEQRMIPSHWMDATHSSWFNSLFEEFTHSIAKNEFVGKEAREALFCVRLVNLAYRSSSRWSEEVECSDLMAY